MKVKALFKLYFIAFLCVETISGAQSFSLQCNGNPILVSEQNDVPLSYGLNTYKYARVAYSGKPLAMEIEASGFESRSRISFAELAGSVDFVELKVPRSFETRFFH